MALDNAAFQFDKLYSYLVPPSLAEQAVPGARVVVPFGRGDQPRVGVVMEEDSPSEGLKSLFFCEQHPLLDGEQVALIDYLKHNAFCAYFDAVRTILPKQLRAAVRCEDGSYSLADHRTAAQETVFFPGSPEGLTPLMRRVFPLVPSKGATRAVLTALTGVSAATLAAMEKRGGLVRGARNKELAVYRRYTPREQPFTLFPEQQAAYDAIRARIEAGAGETLLYGVTSSGKTVVYMRLISDMLAQGRSSILLVPEIAIATQTIYRLREMFGDEVAVLHSGLSESERQLQWLAVREGKCRVVVGTRTAVFAPAQLLGLIIIDEQQESAYLSEQSPRFSAVAVARERRRLCGCHLLQGSATPSVSEYYHAGRHGGIVRLEKRYLGLPLPAVETVDMRQELLAGNTGFVSGQLKRAIDQRLAAGQQVMLLLNRRGYYTVSICTECRQVQKCPHCDAALVYHKTAAGLHCHHCGYQEPVRGSCSACGGTLRFTGLGTQRAEEQLEQLFPSARILRLDLDSASRRGEYEQKLRDFREGRYDIIVGTQMIAKGLDFENVTLAAVLGIDQLLLMQDYRVYERVFSMVTQLVGRSGRSRKGGTALIQTVDPDNPVLALAARQDYDGFFRTEIAMRKACLYPPFCAMYTVGFSGEKAPDVLAAAESFAAVLKRLVAAQGDVPVRLLGPSPFRVGYLAGQYRYKLTVKCRGDARWNRLTEQAMEEFYSDSRFRGIRLSVDAFGCRDD